MEYTIEYFIEKFNAIPAHEMGQGKIENHCALWHCNATMDEMEQTEESIALAKILSHLFKKFPYGESQACVYFINDATVSDLYYDADDDYNSQFHRTLLPMLAKERIIYALQLVQKINNNF